MNDNCDCKSGNGYQRQLHQGLSCSTTLDLKCLKKESNLFIFIGIKGSLNLLINPNFILMCHGNQCKIDKTINQI